VSHNFTVVNGITLAIALLGAVLGVINTWKSIDRDRLKLKVIPKHAIPVGNFIDPRIRFCIDVINYSTFSVTITEVGVLFHNTNVRGAAVNPIIIDGGPFPRRLEPRTSFTAYLLSDALQNEHGYKVKCAYATTDCGEQIKGNSPALMQLAKNL
jgi:hypothetical protein